MSRPLRPRADMYSPVLVTGVTSQGAPMKRGGCGGMLVNWLVSAASAGIAAWLLPGVKLADARSALVLALVLGLLNAVVRPLLVLLTLPVTVVTLGLFLLVVNAGMVLLAARLVNGFSVDGWLSALLFSLILTIATSILDSALGNKRKKD